MEKTKDMKKYLLGILTAMMMAGCSEDALYDQTLPDLIDGKPVFKAVTDNGDGTRAELTSELYINWQTADEISIFAKSATNSPYQLTAGAGTTSGTFTVKKASAGSSTESGSSTELSYYGAIYPYNDANAAASATDGLKLTYTIPATQTYAAGSFDKAAFPMLAVSSTQNLAFKNAAGILKLQLKGTERIKTITLTGNNNEVLAGTFTTPLTTAGEFNEGTSTNTSTTVTLDCSKETDGGVQLTTTPTTFHIVLPPTTFNGGFTVTLNTTEGAVTTLKTTKEHVIERNKIRKMNEVGFTVAHLKRGSEINTIVNALNPAPTKLTFKAKQSAVTGTSDPLVTIEGSTPAYIIKDTSEGAAAADYVITTAADEFLFNADSESMFQNCTSLVSITLPDNIKEIPPLAFHGCTELKNVTIPETVTGIGKGAFYKCSSLTAVNIPSNVTYIDTGAFQGCTNLTSVTIPSKVSMIGNSLFIDSRLTEITIKASATTLKEIGNNWFNTYSSVSLKLHSSWFGDTGTDGNRKAVKGKSGTWLDQTWKEIIPIDDNGNEVTLP